MRIPKINKKITVLIKLLIGFSILGFLINKFNFFEIFSKISSTNKIFYLTAILLNIFGLYSFSVCSTILLKAQKIIISVYRMFEIMLIIRFYSLFLPGGISPSIIKWAKISGSSIKKGTESFSFILFYRYLHLFGLSLLMAFGLLLEVREISIALSIFSSIYIFISILLLLIFFNKKIFNHIYILLFLLFNKITNINIKNILLKIIKSIKMFHRLDTNNFIKVFILIMIGHIFETYGMFFISKSLYINFPISTIFWVRGVAALSAFIPFSIAGLGIRELSLVALLRSYNVSEATILSFSLLFFSLAIIKGLIGGILEIKDQFIIKE